MPLTCIMICPEDAQFHSQVQKVYAICCNFNPFIPSRLFYPYQKDESSFQLRDASYSLLSFLFHIKGKYLFEYANSIA